MGTLSLTSLLKISEQYIQHRISRDTLKACGLSRRTLRSAVHRILADNFAAGRVQRVIAFMGAEIRNPQRAYVERVINTYLQEHQRLDRLAHADPSAWNDLYQFLVPRAYSTLAGFQSSLTPSAEAADFAQHTCEIIFSKPFPCDVAFDAWATRILHNDILQRFTRSREMLDQHAKLYLLDQPDSAEGDSFSLHELLADSAPEAFEARDVQGWLMWAIAQLPTLAQQEVIIRVYLLGYSEAEVAQQLGKSPQAVYNLKHRALRLLYNILADESFDRSEVLTLSRGENYHEHKEHDHGT